MFFGLSVIRYRRRIAGDLRFRWLRQIAAIRHRSAGARRQGRGDRTPGGNFSIAAAMFGIQGDDHPSLLAPFRTDDPIV